MKRILFLLLSLFAGTAFAQPAQPVTAIEWINASSNVEGTPLVDLVSVTFDCGGHQFTIPTTQAGATVSELLPAEVQAMTGIIECRGWSTNAGGESGPASAPIAYACGGGNCFPLGLPAPPILSAP